MRGYFENRPPLLQLLYFFAAAGCSMLCTHPLVLTISLLGGMLYHIKITSGKTFLQDTKLAVPLVGISVVVNGLVNHRGATVLFKLLGKPVTQEALLFGLVTGLSFSAVIVWFLCYSKVFTSEKVMLLFDNKVPTLTLSLTMVLRFVPDLLQKTKEIMAAQRGLGVLVTKGTLKQRAIGGMRVLSVIISYALEGAVQVAASMKSRGYGLAGRTSYIKYTYIISDYILMGIFTVLCGGVGYTLVAGGFSAQFFPMVSVTAPTGFSVGTLVVFYSLPFLVDVLQELKWSYLQSKI